MVRDEPTAALDAETEHALFERYAAAAHKQRGTGREGTHEALMGKHGQYAELYGIQAAAYR